MKNQQQAHGSKKLGKSPHDWVKDHPEDLETKWKPVREKKSKHVNTVQ